ncbi:MAG: hypothetical protein IPO27_17755 [Bacteroidetes bacterium]|nr:hypothetical protein [Bacteroidota bacterium]
MNLTFAINVLLRTAFGIICCIICAIIADQVAVHFFVPDIHNEINWIIPAACVIQAIFDFILVFPLIHALDLRRIKHPTAFFIFKRYLPVAVFASIAVYYGVFSNAAFDFLLPIITINSTVALIVFSFLYIQPDFNQINLNETLNIPDNEINN